MTNISGVKKELEDKGPCGGVMKYMSGEKEDEPDSMPQAGHSIAHLFCEKEGSCRKTSKI